MASKYTSDGKKSGWTIEKLQKTHAVKKGSAKKPKKVKVGSGIPGKFTRG
jgi:hypothetical protein